MKAFMSAIILTHITQTKIIDDGDDDNDDDDDKIKFAEMTYNFFYP